MILHWPLPLAKDSPRPLVSKNGLTFKNPIIGLGDMGSNVGGLRIYWVLLGWYFNGQIYLGSLSYMVNYLNNLV